MPQEILSLRFLSLYTVFLLAQSGSSTFNITRYTKGDIFKNTNSSESCIDTCVLNDENSQFCSVNCCSCVCPSHSPTYLLKNGNCSSEDRLMAILKAQSGIQGESIFVLWKLGLNLLCILNVPSAILNYCAGIVGGDHFWIKQKTRQDVKFIWSNVFLSHVCSWLWNEHRH